MPKIVPLSKTHRRGRHNNLCTLESLNVSTATRIVSDEDMQVSSPITTPTNMIQSFQCSLNDLFVLDDTPLTPHVDEHSSSLELLSANPESDIGGRTNRIARPSPRTCLSSLAGAMDVSAMTPPPSQRFRSCSIDSNNSEFTSPNAFSSPWGQFVDMLVPEEEEVTHNVQFYTMNARFRSHATVSGERRAACLSRERYEAPYPRNRVRQRLGQPTRFPLNFKSQFSDKARIERDCLQDYVLTCPEMDEAATKLGSLSF